MNIKEAAELVAATKPSLLYISGKTCTGKTTFAREIAERFGYVIITLDEIVLDAVIRPLGLEAKEGDVFVDVYRTAETPDLVNRFVAETRKRIAAYQAEHTPILIEGAVANPDVLNQVLADIPDARALYFHPKATDSTYLRNLESRFRGTSLEFRNGLPNGFWKYIDMDEFAQFCKDGIITPSLREGIRNYCDDSTAASGKRLAILKQHLKRLDVVEI